MTEHHGFNTDTAGIDSESPWKVTLSDWNWSYFYKSSPSKWQSLLVRAKNGEPEAECEVASMYEDGCKDKRGKILVRRSAAKAAWWYRRAAEHGDVSAQNNLGVLLGNRSTVRKNVPEALSWLRKAFGAGEGYAGKNIAITYRENGDLKTAVKWFRKAADAGDDDALIQLGIHYYWGKGVRTNPALAVQCFRAAIKSKDISEYDRDDAFFFMGVAYFEGRGVRASTPNARRFLKRANRDGDHPAAKKMLDKLLKNPSARLT
jgi:uncharacterized protein